MIKNFFFRLKRKINHLTIKLAVRKFDDFMEMRTKNYGGIRLISNHYRIRERNYYGEIKEKDLLRFIDQLDEDSVMWDVGANVGYFSIYAAKRGLKVLAFEPDQITANVINKNIYLNNLSGKVLSVPVALNDETKISFFNMLDFLPANAYNTFDRNYDEWGKKFDPDFMQGAIGMRGDDILLDDRISEFSKPNFVKIDVDGNEFKVIKGMKSVLSSARYLCIELGPNHPEFEDLQILLKNLGFKEIDNDDFVNKKRQSAGMRNYYYQKH